MWVTRCVLVGAPKSDMIYDLSAKPVKAVSLKGLPAVAACALCLLLVGTPSAASAAGLHLHCRQYTARELCNKTQLAAKPYTPLALVTCLGFVSLALGAFPLLA